MSKIRTSQSAFDKWLQSAEPNAAGRLSLYRIVYSIFYLAVLSQQNHDILVQVPSTLWEPVTGISVLQQQPSIQMIIGAETALVFSLICLLFGLYTRWSTLTVLVFGTWLAAMRYSFGKFDHTDTFLVVFIPLIFLFADWGRHYSLDNLRRNTICLKEPLAAGSWSYAWPIKVILLLLSILFFTSALTKIQGGWLTSDHIQFLMPKQVIRHWGHISGTNPLHQIILDVPYLTLVLQGIALSFELFFPLALISRRWRTFFVSLAVLFHTHNLLVGWINFLEMLIVYAIFVDWQAVLASILPRTSIFSPLYSTVSTISAQIISLSLALVTASMWNMPVSTRAVFSRLNDATWIIAVAITIIALFKLFSSLFSKNLREKLGHL